ncbi:MAG: F0F1 ATP synthase subunit gamma [Gammaproteobacteria bacterium]|nr:F0F1 ATP synthase subunit gamma [Gammaproteobacteria bacterium]
MSESSETLRRQITSASDLESVVRTMKALAASSISQYERAVQSLDDYYRTVELGLVAWHHQGGPDRSPRRTGRMNAEGIGAVVFGSDQGLVGQFNEEVADFAVARLRDMPGSKHIHAVGERVQGYLNDAGLPVNARFPVPNSITAITPLVGSILMEIETQRERGQLDQVYLFHNCPRSAAQCEPVMQRLLPLDDAWKKGLTTIPWPTHKLPEVFGDVSRTRRTLISEYLFISLFRACAESLASEHTSRLVAMRRAEKNIEGLLEELNRSFNRQRQNAIDEELFDVISGFEALNADGR